MLTSPAVEVDKLMKRYRDGLLMGRRIDALREVSFAVGRGEIFGLLGPNGAGKTTLIKVLLGIVRATAGRAQLLGYRAGSRLGRKEVGYLPENHRIPRHHTGNSALSFFGALSGLSASEIRSRRPALLSTVGLAEWGKMPVRKYSKGMLQRLGLAQAMLHDPDLLILDEPTDGVDPVGRKEMRTILQQLKAEGKTIFINSHLLQEVELVCDRVAILDRGTLLFQGPVSQLTESTSNAEVQLVVAGQERAVREAVAEVAAAGVRPVGPEQFEIGLPGGDQALVDRTVDRLRAAGISLLSMTRTRQTLEEAFLSVLQQAKER